MPGQPPNCVQKPLKLHKWACLRSVVGACLSQARPAGCGYASIRAAGCSIILNRLVAKWCYTRVQESSFSLQASQEERRRTVLQRLRPPRAATKHKRLTRREKGGEEGSRGRTGKRREQAAAVMVGPRSAGGSRGKKAGQRIARWESSSKQCAWQMHPPGVRIQGRGSLPAHATANGA